MSTRLPFAVWIAVAVAACGYYDSSLLAGSEPPSPTEAGADAASAVCPHASPPGKPSVADAGGNLDLVFAVRRLSFGYGSDAGPNAIGYDIDRTCTCQGEPQSCLEPSWAPGDHCDGPSGRDNAGGEVLNQFAAVAPAFGENIWNDGFEKGRFSVLIRVQGYNGLADDDQVQMTWYVAAKFWAGQVNPDAGAVAPQWDGNDAWPVRDTSLKPLTAADGGVSYDVDKPLYRDDQAYVSGGVLVGMVPKGVIQVDAGMMIVLTDPFLTAKLVQGGTSWELQDGVVAGVWRLKDLFSYLGYLSISGVGICVGSMFYGGIKTSICKHVDIYHARGTPTTPCDGLSMAMSFSAASARLGVVATMSSEPKLCDEAHDPANDSCDK